MTPKRVLVIAAHPDDECLGAAGAIARHREEGDAVSVLILGEGVASRAEIPPEETRRLQSDLKEAAAKAQAVLGGGAPQMRSFPDNAFDSVPLLSIVQEIEAVMAETQPELVYTHHVGDVNVDHRIVAEAVEAAARPLANASVREVRAFEIASSSEWNFTRAPFRPDVFVALTERQLGKKMDALRCYASEMREFPHPRSIEYLTALARVRGGQSGSTAAEGFALVYRRE